MTATTTSAANTAKDTQAAPANQAAIAMHDDGAAQAADNAIAKAKVRPHIYSTKGATHKIALWHKTSANSASLIFTGQIDGQTAFVHLRQGPKGPFLAFSGLPKEGQERAAQIATANVFVGPAGIPKLLMKFSGESAGQWVEFSPELAVDIKVACGLSLERQQEVLSGIAERRAQKAQGAQGTPSASADTPAAAATRVDPADLLAQAAGAAVTSDIQF